MHQKHLDFISCSQGRHLVNAQGEAWGQGVILLTWSQVASVEETLVFSCLSWAVGKPAMRKFLTWSAWALYLLCFPQKVDGMQATRLEHIYIYEAPQLGAYREVEEQCTKPLRPWVSGSRRISRQTAPVCYYTLRSGLSPTLMDQQVQGCILLAHITLEEAPIVKKSPKCGVHSLFLL